jgi:hypothetical protein
MYDWRDSGTEKKLDEVKRELCFVIRNYANRYGYNQSRLAMAAGTNEMRIGHVIAHDYKKLRVEQLFRYLTRLHKGYRILISL